jgi:SAM-dependent methyltransferase
MNATLREGALSPPNYFIKLPRIASLCTGALNRCSDAFWERRFNIATGGCIAPRHGDATRYESVPYHTMFKLLDRLQLGADDVVVDIGSGMGRAVCVAASYPIREAVGVELEPDLHAQAQANAARARRLRAPVRLHCGSAAEFDFARVTVALFFNPFGPETMRAVLRRIEASLSREPRTIRIGYVNATCAHVLLEQSWIEVDAWWEMSNWSRVKTPVHFYRAGAAGTQASRNGLLSSREDAF